MDDIHCKLHWEMGILTLLPEHNSWAQLCNFLALIVHAATEHTGGMLCVGNSYCFEDDLMQGHPHDASLQCPIHFHLTQAVEKGVVDMQGSFLAQQHLFSN